MTSGFGEQWGQGEGILAGGHEAGLGKRARFEGVYAPALGKIAPYEGPQGVVDRLCRA